MGDTVALKYYFGEELAYHLASLIRPHYPDFPTETFVQSVARQVGPLELKGRVALITDELHKALPREYPESLRILLSILGPENETEEGMFKNGYFLMPVAFFVEKYGLGHYKLSMNALYEITKRHTSEYAIRPFLAAYPDECFRTLGRRTKDVNLHVRRLVSEGTRPRLPWARRIGVIHGDPAHNLALLKPLLHDPSFYVRKSVANHLNDLTKDYKEVTLEWVRENGKNGGEHYVWIVRHGLRSLVKSGDRDALTLMDRLKR